jgi:hypothetical protein
MRSIFLIFVSGCCLGCGLTDDPDMRELKNSLRITGEEVVAKQDESIVILEENTKALVSISATSQEIVSQNEKIIDTLKTVEAKLIVPKPQREEVIQSAVEPQENPRANQSQPTIPVASSPAVRSSEVKMAWNVEGNWNPSILETAKHLREDHGIIADGMTHQQMHDAHAAAHEGRKVANKSQPVQFVNRGSSCPGGVCPTNTRRGRGLFGGLFR